jgi:hypothetical protein
MREVQFQRALFGRYLNTISMPFLNIIERGVGFH